MVIKFSKCLTGLSLGALLFLGAEVASAQGLDLPVGDAPQQAQNASSIAEAVKNGWKIGRGSSGGAVRELQNILNKSNFPVKVTGVFDAATDQALRKFQMNEGLTGTGLVDGQTYQALLGNGPLAQFRKQAQQRANQTQQAVASAPTAPANNGNQSAGLLGGVQNANAGAASGGSGGGKNALEMVKKFLELGKSLTKGSQGPAVSQLQDFLKGAGFKLPSNGKFGDLTQNAVKAFQGKNGLPQTGNVGKDMLGKMLGLLGGNSGSSNGLPSSAPQVQENTDFRAMQDALSKGSDQAPTWLDIARSQIGTIEIKGKRHNPKIQQYHAAGGLSAKTPDETPWCSSFVNWVMKKAGKGGTGRANARSWLNYGQKLSRPRVGCIVIFSRGSSSWQGHVGFYLSDKGGSIQVLGGNQSNSVKVSNYSKSKVLGYRWPN